MMAIKKKVKPVKKTAKQVKPIKKAVKPVKVKAVKPPRVPLVTCILTGQTFKIRNARLEKEALKLKMASAGDYVMYYVCKEARVLLKEGYTESQIRAKYNCKDRTDLPIRILKCYAKKIKNRAAIIKREKRKVLNEYINNPDPKARYTLKPKTESKFLDMSNPEHVKSLTEFSCARPHIYLDNGRNCNGCNIYKLCHCPIKRQK
jgi:hypothetical protein